MSDHCNGVRNAQEPVRVLGVARMGLARRAQGGSRRRCGDIVDDEQRSDRLATHIRPSDSGVARASAALPVLDDVPTSSASRRLASAPAMPGTRHLLILGQVRALIPILLLVGFAACSRENSIDQTKFEKLFRTGKAIETLSSPNGAVFDKYLKELDSECLAAKSLVATDAEREMVRRYGVACSTLKSARATYEDLLSGTASSQEAGDNWEYALFIVKQAGKWYEAGEIKSVSGTR